ncbi:MAG: hypothetical protein M5U01_11145 [Ardenticatenaceae bacterium]|nr:hypothetical protein [Ardenticatenaceae bacterium]HBY94262.1 hypothetical protein [Chloroflexota bacterium]
MKEERIQILKMIENGQITAEEGAKLLQALEVSARRERAAESAGPSPRGSAPRWFRIRVTDLATGRHKVNVNIPLSLVTVGMRMGARFAPEISGVDMDQVLEAVRSGNAGKIIDVEDMEDGERVEIYIE